MTEIDNFGGNIRFVAARVGRPESESELLDLLQLHVGASVRVIGSLHSWSPIVFGGDALVLELSQLNSVEIRQDGEDVVTQVGAGCTVKRLLKELKPHGVTLPTVGLIDEQTVAGAISTGTHGSGRHSISHYVRAVRLACYDENDKAHIRSVTSADLSQLRAARCGLGMLGAIVSIEFVCRSSYRVEEHMHRHSTLDGVLAQESSYPLQQFFLIPWAWCYYAQHRRETEEATSRLAWLFHLYWFWMVDVLMHLGILGIVRWLRSSRLAKFYFRHVAPSLTVTNWRVVDDSHRMLVMEHELFRHIEIEIFVRQAELAATMQFVETVLQVFGGDQDASLVEILSPERQTRLRELQGTYTHAYPICVRRVLPDDTLISMASGSDVVYAVSFISYARPGDRSAFLQFASFLAESTAELFQARPHWGKVNPLSTWTLRELYLHWPEFAQVCEEFDPNGRFRNHWHQEMLATCDPEQPVDPS